MFTYNNPIMPGRQQFRYYYQCDHYITDVVDPSAVDRAFLVTTMMGLCPRCRWANEHPESDAASILSAPFSSTQLTSDNEQQISTLVINESSNTGLLSSPPQLPPIVPPAPSVQQQQEQELEQEQEQQQQQGQLLNLNASEISQSSSGHAADVPSSSAESWVHVPTPGGSSIKPGTSACIANNGGDNGLDKVRDWRRSQSQIVREKGDWGATPITVSSPSLHDSDSDASVRFLGARRRSRLRVPFEPTVKVLQVRRRQRASATGIPPNSNSNQGVELVKVCEGHHETGVIVPTKDSNIEVVIQPRTRPPNPVNPRRRDGEQAWIEADEYSRRATAPRGRNRIAKKRPRGLEASLAETGSSTSGPGRGSSARRRSSPVRNSEEAADEDERYQEKLVQYLHGLVLEFEPNVYANTGIDPEFLSLEQHHKFLNMKMREYAAELHERRYRSALIKQSSSSPDLHVQDEA